MLVVLDLSGAKSGLVPVVLKPSAKADTVLPKPGYSAALSVDRARGRVYAMDAASLELRWFSFAALLNAYNTHTPLEWATDGTPVGAPGQYFNGGVSGITPEGYLVIGGALGWGLAGGVQYVNPESGAIVQTQDPSGRQAYTSVIYNGVTGRVTVMSEGLTYVEGALSELPVAGSLGLTFLMAAFPAAFVLRRRWARPWPAVR